jgi:hypothetical protein
MIRRAEPSDSDAYRARWSLLPLLMDLWRRVVGAPWIAMRPSPRSNSGIR